MAGEPGPRGDRASEQPDTSPRAARTDSPTEILPAFTEGEIKQFDPKVHGAVRNVIRKVFKHYETRLQRGGGADESGHDLESNPATEQERSTDPPPRDRSPIAGLTPELSQYVLNHTTKADQDLIVEQHRVGGDFYRYTNANTGEEITDREQIQRIITKKIPKKIRAQNFNDRRLDNDIRVALLREGITTQPKLTLAMEAAKKATRVEDAARQGNFEPLRAVLVEEIETLEAKRATSGYSDTDGRDEKTLILLYAAKRSLSSSAVEEPEPEAGTVKSGGGESSEHEDTRADTDPDQHVEEVGAQVLLEPDLAGKGGAHAVGRRVRQRAQAAQVRTDRVPQIEESGVQLWLEPDLTRKGGAHAVGKPVPQRAQAPQVWKRSKLPKERVAVAKSDKR